MGRKQRARERATQAAELLPIGGETRPGNVRYPPGTGWTYAPMFNDGWYPLAPTELEALGIATVWRCVTLIADAISGRDWAEWRGLQRLPPSRLVRKPCSWMTRREWTWRVTATLALYNTAYLYWSGGVDSEGVPGSLIPLPPQAISPVGPVDPWGILPPTQFRVGDTVVSSEYVTTLRRAILPSTPAYLSTLLSIARNTFATALMGDAYGVSYWREGGTPNVVVSVDTELTVNQADEIAERYLAKHRTKAPLVLGKGGKASPFGADPNSDAAIAARRELVADVARLFGVPAYLVNAPVTASLTYITTEAQGLDLIRYTLNGYAQPIEDAVSELLPGDPSTGRRVRIDFGGLTAGEQATRFQAWSNALDPVTGWMTRPEVRIAEGLPPDVEIQPQPEPGEPADVGLPEPAAVGSESGGAGP